MLQKPNIVLIGGGVGSSTFTKALKDSPVNLSTIVNTFDDGGSTGAIRRDYGGFSLGDFRQCIIASLDLQDEFINTLNFRFGAGALYGVNVGNIIIKAFFQQYKTERLGVKNLHKVLNLGNWIIPVSYDFSKLCAKLSNGGVLHSQEQIASHLSFAEAPIKSLSIKPKPRISEEAQSAIIKADFLVFAPGHFFTSILPHLYVEGFATAWANSKAKKIWFFNLLAHKGQDSFYTLRDYLNWFQKILGQSCFDLIVVNKLVPQKILNQVKDRFEETKITSADIAYLKKINIELKYTDLISHNVRKQQHNDPIMRAPLRHDVDKIRQYLKELIKY